MICDRGFCTNSDLQEHKNIHTVTLPFKSSMYIMRGFGGLGVACWPLVPKFAGSNPAEAVGFLGVKKSSARRQSHVVDLRHVKDP